MKTIEIYEKTDITELQKLLTHYEAVLQYNEILIRDSETNDEYLVELEKKSIDYEIDINIIRMELNKRLWEN